MRLRANRSGLLVTFLLVLAVVVAVVFLAFTFDVVARVETLLDEFLPV